MKLYATERKQREDTDGVYFIEAADIGLTYKKVWADDGTSVNISFKDIMGRVMAHDVGKKMVYRHGVWKVENDEQLSKRLGV